jgi:hypothetical protein
MQAFKKTWYTPNHQRKGKPEVKFELQQLDQRTFYTVQQGIGPRGPSADAAIDCFEYAVTGWEGLEIEYSLAAKRSITSGIGSLEWTIWMAEITAHTYRQSLLGESEAKN